MEEKKIWTTTSVHDGNVHTNTFRNEMWFLRYIGECYAAGGKIIYAAVVDFLDDKAVNITVLTKYMVE